MPKFRETVDFEVEVKRLSDAAVLVILDGEDVWFPFSQISDDSEIGKESEQGDDGTLTVSEWIAIEKELA